MSTWPVSEITLEAHFYGGEPDPLTTACRSLSLPPQEFTERSGADGAVQRSLKPRILTAVGVDASRIRSLPWARNINRLTYRDAATGKEETFEVRHLGDTSRQDEVCFVLRR
jgi:hypothetical protein